MPDVISAPDPEFWEKYSPNQELPISSLASVAIHLGVAAVLVLFLNFVLADRGDSAMPLETIDDGSLAAGGGGDPSGTAVSNVPGPGRVERATADEIPPDAPKPNTVLGNLPEVRDILPEVPANPASSRVVESGGAKDQLANVQGGRPGPPQSAGKGGPGSGGGQGSGTGPGTGSGDQPGSQGSIRHRRNKRWTLSFSTSSGSDYLRQLSSLGAVLVAEFPDGSTAMYRKLDAVPCQAEPIDSDIRNRLVWVDERPGAVRELADAMGMARSPSSIKAYFPYKLENEMLKLELGYRGKKEEEIHATVFRVLMEGLRYRLVVSEQSYR